GMGHDARRSPRVHSTRLVGRHLPGPGDPHHSPRHQPDGRRPARCARPETEEVLIMALLQIDNLTVEFETASGWFRAVDGVSLSVDAGEVLAIVGESGSGKSVAMLAVMGLLPWTAKITADRMLFEDKDIQNLGPTERRTLI